MVVCWVSWQLLTRDKSNKALEIAVEGWTRWSRRKYTISSPVAPGAHFSTWRSSSSSMCTLYNCGWDPECFQVPKLWFLTLSGYSSRLISMMYELLFTILVGLTEHTLEVGIQGFRSIFKIPSAVYLGGGVSYTGSFSGRSLQIIIII